MNIAILLGGAGYLGWLSWKVLLTMLGFIVIGGLGYRLFIASGFRRLTLAREEEDKLFRHFRALTEGIKELKLHRNRRGDFLRQDLQTTTEKYQRHNVAAEIRFVLAHTWGHLLFFLLVGVLLFLLPKLEPLTTRTLTGYVITTLT
jgi:putative ATP-binding cassette transporter